MVAKVGLGLLGLGAIGVGGVVVTKPYLLGMDYMPNYTTLSKKVNDLNNKWAKDYRIYFVDSEGNDYWFDWVFRNRYNNEDSKNKTAFTNIKQGWGKDADGSLAKACKEAYDAASGNTKIKTTENEAKTTGDFFEDNIWKYCSIGGTKLKKLSEGPDKEKHSGKLGGNNKDNLLSTEDNSNDWAWHIKQEEFLKGTKPSEQGVLQKFYEDNKKYETEKNGTKLKEGCKQWYGKDENNNAGANKLTATDLKKYCSFKVDGSGA